MSDVPKQLGKYQIRRAIGKGAMGIVYEGFDPVIDRIVAIKTIKKDELDPEEAEEHSRRFLIEAKAAGRLNHKNIVGIYDYGEEKGLSFIVMEFVQGKELKSFFAARHPFSMSQIVRLMGELLDALGYSHSRGVVHRDVKPDNIFVTDDGMVKLGDFGIARIDSTSKTHAGTVLGTPSYMAPEQIRGETADARSDLYAAGVILYQFLVGERPFSGGMVAVMQKVLMEAPKPPSGHNPSIPEAIDAVVLRALSKLPDARFASAAEFSRELTAAVGLADSEDESESTMIMSAAALKALQDGAAPADRTGTSGTGGTRTGTGTGTSTGTGATATGSTGRSSVGGSGSRASAVEEARRRAEEAKRRYEEDLRRAEVELQQAEEEQRRAEAEAQAQSAEWLKTSASLLEESDKALAAGQALFTDQTLLVDGPKTAQSVQAIAGLMRESGRGIGEFVAASYALAPAAQAELETRQATLADVATAQEALAARITREAASALSSVEQKLDVLEKRLAAQDGAWGNESRALEALDPEAGESAVAPIQGRLDKLSTSVDQVGKGFQTVKSQPYKLPPAHAERLAVIEAQLQAQSGFVARLRTETEAARERVRAAAEARRKAQEEAARKKAEAEEARRKADEEARRKAEEEARRKAEEDARRKAEEEARRKAEEEARAKAEAEARRQAEERARREAEEAAARAKAQAEAAAEKQRQAAELAERQAAEEARRKAEAEARRQADAKAKAEADAAAKAEAERKAAEAAQRKADEEARKKAEADAKREAQAEARRKAEEQARLKAEEDARQKAEAEAKRQAEARAKAEADAAAKAKADAEAAARAKAKAEADAAAKAKADAEAAARSKAAAAQDDAEATVVGTVRPPRDDDAETTVVRPVGEKPVQPERKPPVASPPPRAEPPVAAPPQAPKKNNLLVPIAGAAVVAIAAGAWFALRPSATPATDTAVTAPAPAPVASAVAAAPASAPAPVAQQASAPTAAPVPDNTQAAKLAAEKQAQEEAHHKAQADAEAKARADAELAAKAKAKADADAKALALADAKAKADADAKALAEAKAKAAEAKPAETKVADAKPAETKVADAKPAETKAETKADAKADAADTFSKGYAAYLAGRVPEGIRMMERADSMGAPGARARLCAIYRKPTAAEGKDFLKEANKCKGID